MMNKMKAETIPNTALQKALNQYGASIGGSWKPNESTYERIGVKKKRFWQLVRGEKRPTIDEARALSELFKVPVTDLF